MGSVVGASGSYCWHRLAHWPWGWPLRAVAVVDRRQETGIGSKTAGAAASRAAARRARERAGEKADAPQEARLVAGETRRTGPAQGGAGRAAGRTPFGPVRGLRNLLSRSRAVAAIGNACLESAGRNTSTTVECAARVSVFRTLAVRELSVPRGWRVCPLHPTPRLARVRDRSIVCLAARAARARPVMSVGVSFSVFRVRASQTDMFVEKAKFVTLSARRSLTDVCPPRA